MKPQNDYTPNIWSALPPQTNTQAEIWNPYAMKIEPAVWNGRVWIAPQGTAIQTAYWMQPRRPRD